jgi:hypothetical protein
MITSKRIGLNLVWPRAELPRRAAGALTTSPRLPVPSIVRQRYAITALCHNDHGDAVERLMRIELCSAAIWVEQIETDRRAWQHLVRVVAVVKCTAHARAGLLHLVNRLGLDAAVRSVHWQTAPPDRPSLTERPFDARVTTLDSISVYAPNRGASPGQ